MYCRPQGEETMNRLPLWSLFKTATKTQARPRLTGGQASRPCIEALEDRYLPSFALPVPQDIGPRPTALAAADFNGDGDLDLAAAHEHQSTVGVILVDGTGSFQAPRNSGVGVGRARLLLAADVNRDGRSDLVTLNDVGDPALTDDVSVLLSNTDGTFQAPRSVELPGQFPPGYTGTDPVPQLAQSVTVGELNNDGNADLVLTAVTFVLVGYDDEFGNPIYNGYFYFNALLGDRQGSFHPALTELNQVDGPPALGDFNGDEWLDVAY